jgi:hypothetical protein
MLDVIAGIESLMLEQGTSDIKDIIGKVAKG